jgi:hypothetical protein
MAHPGAGVDEHVIRDQPGIRAQMGPAGTGVTESPSTRAA